MPVKVWQHSAPSFPDRIDVRSAAGRSYIARRVSAAVCSGSLTCPSPISANGAQ